MFRSANPVLRDETFTGTQPLASDEVMSIQGTVNKTGMLALIVLLGAAFVWKSPTVFLPFMWLAIIGGLIAAIVTAFKPTVAWVSAPVYAVLEGLVLGCISSLMEQQYAGIVMQAIGLTIGTLFAMLLAYSLRIVRATETFKHIIFAATGGVFLFYMISMILSWFGVGMPLLTNNGPVGIGLSVVICGIAAFNLVIDFDFIEQGAAQSAPKYMEWYGAFALMVTLIWLYMEILRLLAKMQRR